ncbi:hypothetical protein PT974_03684 [Cladobotryum mycophilum]|uniref:Uncharacterized protein n=1 Tax=Cladobotryum mycophilum TaxID=491253 RepID=A0ABR0ST43_9HYPO
MSYQGESSQDFVPVAKSRRLSTTSVLGLGIDYSGQPASMQPRFPAGFPDQLGYFTAPYAAAANTGDWPYVSRNTPHGEKSPRYSMLSTNTTAQPQMLGADSNQSLQQAYPHQSAIHEDFPPLSHHPHYLPGSTADPHLSGASGSFTQSQSRWQNGCFPTGSQQPLPQSQSCPQQPQPQHMNGDIGTPSNGIQSHLQRLPKGQTIFHLHPSPRSSQKYVRRLVHSLDIYFAGLNLQQPSPKGDSKVSMCPCGMGDVYSLDHKCWKNSYHKAILRKHLSRCHSDRRAGSWSTLDPRYPGGGVSISQLSAQQHEKSSCLNHESKPKYWKRIYSLVHGKGSPMQPVYTADTIKWMRHFLKFLKKHVRQHLNDQYRELPPDIRQIFNNPEELYQNVFRLWLPGAFKKYAPQNVKLFGDVLQQKNEAIGLSLPDV